MAVKGAQGKLYPQAKMMYGDGKSIKEISDALGVSETSLYKWKSNSKVPGERLDDWDKARQNKQDFAQSMRELFCEQRAYIKSLLPEERDSRAWDSLSKAFAIVERSEKRETEIRRKAIEEAAEVVEQTARERGDSDDEIKFWQEKVLGIR